MLFSDIEGSTALLSRLGSEYAYALGAQRTLMRRAWSDHGGIELGTEGDSFYVVFETAPDAAWGAVDAQRALATYPWPQGEAVRVRIGMHTGSPAIHGDTYVGMDVHRAARVAGAAHGGQVVLSNSTSALVAGCLPEATALVDLGRHVLKDMPAPERLHQLTIDGLQSDFPPLKTLGSTSRLPVPATPLVGRDTEVASLVARVASPDTRLVTLIGPGGTGKTRLAIAVAERLWTTMADGVYFVPMATVTATESAWPLVAESLGLPPEVRSTGDVAAAVADKQALFVLDNLEQVADADIFAAELLSASPRSRVVVTSRRPLHTSGEHEFPVPPLELPTADDVADVGASPAVRMFVQHAQRVRPAFELTADNSAAVAAVCRHLDGLPLGLELAAARIKLLSPSALLNRLGSVLDVAAATTRGSDRQRTLRSTISWSYDLLDERSQTFFRRLGVFGGGGDLAAVAAVTQAEADALDAVSDLLDASLIGVVDDPSGEPRVVLLETIRAYALDMLAHSGDLESTRDRHARHFLAVAQHLVPMLEAERYQFAKARLGSELGNLREALDWTLPENEPVSMPAGRRALGIELCAETGIVWASAFGYPQFEGLPFTRRAIERDTRGDGVALARCLTHASSRLSIQGKWGESHDKAVLAVAMCRRLDDPHRLIDALNVQAIIDSERGAVDDARDAYEEALMLTRKVGNQIKRHEVIADMAIFVETHERDYERALALKREALALAHEIGSPFALVLDRHNIACSLRLLGQLDEALAQMRSVIPEALKLNIPSGLMYLAEDFAAILAERGEARLAAWLLGTADASHKTLQAPRPSPQEAEIAEPMATARAALTSDEWDAAYAAGHALPIDEMLQQALQETG